MKFNLIAFIFVLFFVSQVNGSKKSKFPNINEKSLNLVNDNNGNVLDGSFCKSLTAYYVGILENKKSQQNYNVQFQLKLWINDEKKKIHVYADKWNEKYSKSEDFELDFYCDANRLWCDIYDDDCTAPIAKKDTTFNLDLNTASGNYFHLLSFNHFNNSFGLNNPVGKCSRRQLGGLNNDYNPDLSQLSYCVCCDEYEPDELLGCPSNKWNDKETTCKPLETTKKTATTTKKLIKTTTISLVPHAQTCQKIIGYYVGTFQATWNRSITFDAQFQFKMDSNLKDKKVYFGITNWNQSYFHGDYDGLLDLTIGDYNSVSGKNVGYHECITPDTNRTAPLVKSTVDRYIALRWLRSFGFWLNILNFPSFNNSFTLKNTIGCEPDTSLYSYCVCCDEYNPHPSLNCPPNPWQGL